MKIKEKSQFEAKKEEVARFNAENRWKKRGISMLPTAFGMSFVAKFMNAAGALVHIYTDGTVLVSHGGTEMGQGLHTKIAQIAAEELQLDIKNIYVEGTGTDIVANGSSTAASVSSDLNGMAVYDACRQLKERLQPFRDKLGKSASLAQISQEAYFGRVDLSAHGYYITPDIGFDWVTGKGKPFHYFSYGAAVSLIELDVLTGDYLVLRTDIVHDVGRSLNPAVDIGQVRALSVLIVCCVP